MRTAVLALVGLACAACATSTRPEAQSSEQTVRVVGASGTVTLATTPTARPRIVTLETPLDAVWRALPAAYAAMGIEIAQRDAGRGIIGNPGFRARRRLGDTSLARYLDCGTSQGGQSAETYEVHFSVLTELTTDPQGRTVISTNVDATARPVNFPGDPVRCLSRGELENRIVNSVRESVQG
jgi:hypothetical protein